MTPFTLRSTDSWHFLQNQGRRKPQEKWNGFVDVLGEPVPKLKGHMKKCMFKIIVEGDRAMLIRRRREMLSLNFGWDLEQAGHDGLESEGRLQVCNVIKRRAIEGAERKVEKCCGQSGKTGNDLCGSSVCLLEHHLCLSRTKKRMWQLIWHEYMEDSFPLCTWLHVSAYADLLTISWGFCRSFFNSLVPGNNEQGGLGNLRLGQIGGTSQ